MKKLNELINCNYDINITGIKINSSLIEPGDLFICTDMGTVDRHLFIDDAINRGASAIIVKNDVQEKNIPIIKVDNPNKIFSSICSKFYDEPEKKLRLIGITGTDGKTTTATIVQTLIGNDCGYIGTNGINCNKFYIDSPNTTPDANVLYDVFHKFVDNNISNVAMEISSEALMRGRVNNLEFDCSILTNITKEHLNIHHTLENYIDSKCELFRKCKKNGICVVNIDDINYETVIENCNGAIKTYGSKETADLYFYDIKLFTNKTIFKIKYKNQEYEIISPLLALFNVYNLCAALLALLELNYNIYDLINNIKSIKVKGRLESINLGQNFSVIVDYAHTPNGIKELLNFTKKLNVNKTIVVFSEPGERDKSKRAEKGYNVITNCDHAIITTQDPRTENPADIANDLLELVKDYTNYEIILDRGLAIKKAINMASNNDLVLIIGKGAETHHQFKDKQVFFCDIDEAKKCLNEKLNNISI